MALAAITHSSETIGAVYAPSLNAAFQELFDAFGFWPVVYPPYGGARTPAEQREVNPGQTVSDHVKERAVDINNHRRFRDINQRLFLAILRKHGWLNVQVNGDPFPAEPWHFANQSTNPAGGTGVLIITPKRRKKTEMQILIRKIVRRPDNSDNMSLLRLVTDQGRAQEWNNNNAQGSAGRKAFDDIVATFGPWTETTEAQWTASTPLLARPVFDASGIPIPVPSGGGTSLPPDLETLIARIDAADDDEHAALLAAVNKPRTVS